MKSGSSRKKQQAKVSQVDAQPQLQQECPRPAAVPTTGSPLVANEAAGRTAAQGGEDGPGSSPAKKRHQRSRSIGKGGIMNLIGIKKKNKSKLPDSTASASNGEAEIGQQVDSTTADSIKPRSADDNENEQSPNKTMASIDNSSSAINTKAPSDRVAFEDTDESGSSHEFNAIPTDSTSSSSVDDQSKHADTEEEDDVSSEPAHALISSVSWHSPNSGGVTHKKKLLGSSSSSVPEQEEADEPARAFPSSPRRASAVASATSAKEVRIKRRSLPSHMKLFPPLPSTPVPPAPKESGASEPPPPQSEAETCEAKPISVLGQSQASKPAPVSAAPRPHVSAVSAMHQTRPIRKRMTMDAASLKALYAQDRTGVLSGQRSTSAESQEVLAVLLTLVESGIEEEDIWNGEPEVFSLLEPYKNELKKAVEAGCNKSSVINFQLPDMPLFGGLNAKTFKVNNLQPIAQLVQAITAKLGGRSMTLRRSTFALATLAGYQLDPREILATYGMGSILQMWELKIVIVKRGQSGVHARVDKKPLPNPQQLMFEQVKTLQSQTVDLSQRVCHSESEQKQLENRIEELTREIEKSERDRGTARKIEAAERQKRARREWLLDVEGGIDRLRSEVEQRVEQREEKLHAEIRELRNELELERSQAKETEDRLKSALTGLVEEVEVMRNREVDERKRVEGLVAVFREELEERERERERREKAMQEEIESTKALLKGGEEAKHVQSELDVAKVVAALQAENDKQRKELVKRVHDDWEREKHALLTHMRGEWEKETKTMVVRLREDWERERAREHDALVKRVHDEREKEREQSEERQKERFERERREVKGLVEQESGNAIREVLEDVEDKMAKLQGLLERSEKKIERQSKALELLDKRVKSSPPPASSPIASAADTGTPPPPPAPPTIAVTAAPSPIAKPAASKRPVLKREDRSCADLLLAGLQKRFSAIQQIEAEELEDDDTW